MNITVLFNPEGGRLTKPVELDLFVIMLQTAKRYFQCGRLYPEETSGTNNNMSYKCLAHVPYYPGREDSFDPNFYWQTIYATVGYAENANMKKVGIRVDYKPEWLLDVVLNQICEGFRTSLKDSVLPYKSVAQVYLFVSNFKFAEALERELQERQVTV